ncbi:MAG: AMP-binding protein [Gammaproteobacteria bacterium]|nr:AMP-binding protein [Gammaproteobacteria bacterium]
MSAHPVFKYKSLDSPVVFFKGRWITLKELLITVDYLSKKVPDHQYILNLYDERYYFLIGFLLGLKKKTISLFPSTITSHVLEQLKDKYKALLVLSDPEQALNDFQIFDLKKQLSDYYFSSKNQVSDKALLSILPEIELNQHVVTIFTSGSTGQPKPYVKQWNDLIISSRHLTDTLFTDFIHHSNNNKTLHMLLATVPAQHMYGLEASIMVALQNGFLIHSNKPFFPQDITQCLEEMSLFAEKNQQLLATAVITTPLHLKACINTEVSLPNVEQFISATAPLQEELAQRCEQQYSAHVMEIFGCTEVGSIATRRTIANNQWTVLNDISLEVLNQNDVQINTLRSIKKFLFNDIIELIDDRHFILKGRKEDMINIAGKRTSLAYLNHHLQSYEALSDACFYQNSYFEDSQIENKTNDLSENRLIAFVVLKQTNKFNKQQINKKIRTHLQHSIESIFLPKKIFVVESLPRNATGKLPQSELKKLLRQQDKE